MARALSTLLLAAMLSATDATHGRGSDAAAFDSLELQRWGCFGTCPTYTVLVRADGSVQFNGTKYVGQPGEHTATLSSEEVATLGTALQKARLGALRSVYEPGKPGCHSFRTDDTTISITTVIAGKERGVRYYKGCDTPKDVWRIDTLALAIDRIAKTSQWIEGYQGGRDP